MEIVYDILVGLLWQSYMNVTLVIMIAIPMLHAQTLMAVTFAHATGHLPEMASIV